MKTTQFLRRWLPTVLSVLLLAVSTAVAADSDSSTLQLADLAARARARQSALEADLAALDSRTAPAGTDAAAFAASQSAERQRLVELRDRNARLLSAYESRLGDQSAPAGAPAAPGSSDGGLMSKLSGMFGGGSGGDSPGGPVSEAFGAGGAMGSGGIMGYLKENWPNLVGGMIGSVAGGMIASRLTGGNKIAGIAGSIAGGWLGGKLGTFIYEKVTGKKSGSGGSGFSIPGLQAKEPSSDPVQTYSQGPAYGQPTGQAPAAQLPAVPQAGNLAEARELMTGRYQAFLAASGNSDPALQAALYQNYLQAKAQYQALAGAAASGR